MLKNIIILLCVAMLGYSYMTDTSAKDIINKVKKESADYNVKFAPPIVLEKS